MAALVTADEVEMKGTTPCGMEEACEGRNGGSPERPVEEEMRLEEGATPGSNGFQRDPKVCVCVCVSAYECCVWSANT